ncbi:hypothetical protein [Saccharicrinis aurantiacus]|uniref:hypothetical protein n=1 Tax=Saccharicrinis aurantiacus TaxID=1849719 RepID=UPI00083977E4|nr:hypothetical protein [Saccharicrinis aurantiacus]
MRNIGRKEDFRVDYSKLDLNQKSAFDSYQNRIKQTKGVPTKRDVETFLSAGFTRKQAVGVLSELGSKFIITHMDFPIRLRLIQSIIINNMQ